jgi:hypothetical protein
MVLIQWTRCMQYAEHAFYGQVRISGWGVQRKRTVFVPHLSTTNAGREGVSLRMHGEQSIWLQKSARRCDVDAQYSLEGARPQHKEFLIHKRIAYDESRPLYKKGMPPPGEGMMKMSDGWEVSERLSARISKKR